MEVALLLGAFAFLAIVASGDSSEDSDEDSANDDDPTPPKPSPKPQAQPGPPDPLADRHKKGFVRAVEAWKKDRAAQLQEAQRIEEYKSTTHGQSTGGNVVAAGLAIAAAAANAIPIGGQVVSALLAAVALLVKVLPQGQWLPKIEAHDFTGWRQDCFWYHDIPIWGPASETMLGPMPHPYMNDNSQSYEGLRKLIAFFPHGPSWPVEISVRGTGGTDSYFEYDYSFNFDRPGDLSLTERALEHIRTMQVWAPEDITPKGPRGFSPSDPWGWKVPGARRAKLQDVVVVRPGDLLI